MNKNPSELIDIGELRIGMYVDLEVGWMAHPFATGSFRIVSQRQIEIIQSLGLSQVRYFPQRDDLIDLTGPWGGPVAPTAAPPRAAEPAPAKPAVPTLAERVSAQRRALLQCERRFQEAAALYKFVFEQASAQPQEARLRCERQVAGFIADLKAPGDMSVRLLSAGGAERLAIHAVNVTVLSLLLGKAMGLAGGELSDLGLAALLHDAGGIFLPERVRYPDDQFSAAEYKLYQEHVEHGVELGRRMGLAPGVLSTLAQHHEMLDGSGFPRRLKGDGLSLAGKILAVVNRYENLCNPSRAASALTPHEALSSMFTEFKGRFDGVVLSAFIRMLGVHPPGSVIQLTNDRYALVVAANASRPLKPRVLMHDPAVPRHEALVIDLEQVPDIGIRRGIRPASLPANSADYLEPHQRVSYFFESAQPEALVA